MLLEMLPGNRGGLRFSQRHCLETARDEGLCARYRTWDSSCACRPSSAGPVACRALAEEFQVLKWSELMWRLIEGDK